MADVEAVPGTADLAAGGSFSELLGGWIEYAYTWRDLVRAAHRTGPHRNELKHWPNDFARPDHGPR